MTFTDEDGILRVARKTPPTLDEIAEKKAHLVALDAFIASPAHRAYKVGKQKEAGILASAILELDITTIEGVLLMLQQKGEYKAAQDAITQFETTRADLKQWIDEMVDAELTARQTNTNAIS